MGLTTAFFSLSGKIPKASDLLEINSEGLLITHPHNFIILLQIPSYPDKLSFSDPIMLINSVSVTGTIFILGNPPGY